MQENGSEMDQNDENTSDLPKSPEESTIKRRRRIKSHASTEDKKENETLATSTSTPTPTMTKTPTAQTPIPQNQNPATSTSIETLSEEELFAKRRKLEDDIKKLETQIYHLESSYLEETWSTGNVVKGWDGYVTSRNRPSTATARSSRFRFKDTDRIFSFSSSTSAKNLGYDFELFDPQSKQNAVQTDFGYSDSDFVTGGREERRRK